MAILLSSAPSYITPLVSAVTSVIRTICHLFLSAICKMLLSLRLFCTLRETLCAFQVMMSMLFLARVWCRASLSFLSSSSVFPVHSLSSLFPFQFCLHNLLGPGLGCIVSSCSLIVAILWRSWATIHSGLWPPGCLRRCSCWLGTRHSVRKKEGWWRDFFAVDLPLFSFFPGLLFLLRHHHRHLLFYHCWRC